MVIVRLAFHNRTARDSNVIFVERAACEPIARWYGAYSAGDDYSVFIDDELQTIDIDGVLATDPDNRL